MKARGTLAALLLPLLVVFLAACGGGSDSSATDPVASETSSTATDPSSPTEAAEPSDSASPTPDWPACSDIWVADGKLPHGYQGCLEGDDPVKADNLPCSSGQRIVRYGDRFYGVAGGTIYEASGPLDMDKQYLKMVRVCRA